MHLFFLKKNVLNLYIAYYFPVYNSIIGIRNYNSSSRFSYFVKGLFIFCIHLFYSVVSVHLERQPSWPNIFEICILIHFERTRANWFYPSQHKINLTFVRYSYGLPLPPVWLSVLLCVSKSISTVLYTNHCITV